MSTTDVAVRNADLVADMEMARVLATADGIPKHYRGNPANVLIAVRFGAAIGLTPEQALAEIYVVDAKPSASANVIAGLVRKAGHTLRVTFDRRTKTARAVIVRKDDPDFEFVAEWDIEKARTADLLKKDNWQHYPEAMLKRRATTEVARDACPEALHGILYERDELESLPRYSVERIDTPPSADRLIPTSTGLVDGDTGEVVDGETVDDTPDGMDEFTRTDSDAATPDQLNQITLAMKALKLTKADALALVNDWCPPAVGGALIGSANELTSAQADVVLDNLEALIAAQEAGADQ